MSTSSLRQSLKTVRTFPRSNQTFTTTIEQVTEEGFRFYRTPVGNLPSVTTVLGPLKKHILDRWRATVGQEEADRITKAAQVRGTRVHKLCENYLNGELDDTPAPNMLDLPIFKQIQRVVDKHVDLVYAQELGLYSKFLRTAGMVDLVAMWDGKPAIVDFKTSNKYKSKDEISAYFMQASAYAVMWEELFGMSIQKIVIIIAVDHVPEAQVFVERRDDHIFKFIEVRNDYKETFDDL